MVYIIFACILGFVVGLFQPNMLEIILTSLGVGVIIYMLQKVK
jgi:hypothetical protein